MNKKSWMYIYIRVIFSAVIVLAVMSSMSPSMILAEEQTVEMALLDKFKEVETEVRGDKLEVSLLLRAIGRQAGVNIIVDESIEDTISLDLGNITLFDVFQLIMESKDLKYYESNNALLVEKGVDFRADQKDVVMVRLCSRFGDVTNHVDELSILKSEIGSITVSNDGNCLVVRDHEENVERVRTLLGDLDKPLPQVHIKARIVTIDKAVSRQLGIKWGYEDLSRLPDTAVSAAVDLSIVNPTTNIVFGFIRDTFNLDVELSAMQEKNELHILSSPRIVVLDGQEAEIKQGKEIPYESGTRENRNTSFREAVLSLNVTPQILQNTFIRLNVKVTNDSVDEDNSTDEGQPLINRQEIRTDLLLEDGVTVVVGGILAKGSDFSNEEVPFLADIPLIGNLFKNRDELDRVYELLVFITPTIINETHGFMTPETLRKGGGVINDTTLLGTPAFKHDVKEEELTGYIGSMEEGGLILGPVEVEETSEEMEELFEAPEEVED